MMGKEKAGIRKKAEMPALNPLRSGLTLAHEHPAVHIEHMPRNVRSSL